MATSEILGLFQTPDQYAAAQDAALQKQFIQRATLDPFQKASVLGQQAGYSAAQGIGGALGGTDPQLEMISRRNVLLSQLNPSDPSSYIKAAEVAAKMGDSQFAVLIAQEGRKAQSEVALTAQRNAAAARERLPAVNPNIQIADQIAALKISLKRLEAVPSSPETDDLKESLTYKLEELTRLSGTKQPEFELKEQKLQGLKANLRVLKSQPEPNKEAIQRIEDSIQAIEGVPKEASVGTDREAVSKELYFKPYSSLTQDEVVKVNALVAQREKEKIKAGVPLPAQQAKQVMQNKTDLYNEVEKSAYNSSDRVTLARNLKSLLPTAFIGVDANLKLQTSRLAEVFGINIQGVPESQIIDTILGEMTIGAASKLKGGLSDKDVKFLKETIGTRGLSVRTLEFVADKIEQDALIDGGLNEVVNKFVASGGDLNTFNFASQRKDVAEKVRKDLARIKELRGKAKPQ